MNDENLRVLTSEEAREIGRKGGLKSVEVRRQRKTLREQLLALLSEGNVQNNLCLAILEKAQKGDTKAFEVIRDTVGEKPTEKTEFVGELPPLVVRELKTDDTRDGNCDTVSASD